MKYKSFAWLCFFPIFLLQSCGGGSIVLKAKDGSKIRINKEDVVCTKDIYDSDGGIEGTKGFRKKGTIAYIYCRANGVRTDLTNRQYPFSEKKDCFRRYLKPPGDVNQNSFACSAAKEFGIYINPNVEYHPEEYEL